MLERRTPVKADITTRPEESKRVVLGAQAMVKRVSVKGSSRGGATELEAPAAGSSAAPARSTAPVPARAALPSLSSPEMKAGALLASLVFFVLTAVLAPFGVVPGWMPLLGVVALGGVVFWLRRSALAARKAKASMPTARVKPSATTMNSSGVKTTGVKVSQTTASVPPEAHASASAPAESGASTRKRLPLVADRVVEAPAAKAADDDVVFDQEPDGARAKRAEAEVFDARRWAPVEVPRPTYTLKARAERDEVAPAATINETEARPAAAEQVDVRPLAARYENTPVEELPFDGMALDEDYDELPEVFRAG